MNKKTRLIISITGFCLTVGAFIFYLSRHTYLITKLTSTSPALIVWLVFLYMLSVGVLVIIFSACMLLCGKSVNTQENFLLNAYSLFINFFVPGQGGPAFRALYMKKRHKLNIGLFAFATLLYYVFYAVINVFLLFVNSKPLWQTILAVLLVIVVCAISIKAYSKKSKLGSSALNLSPKTLGYLFIATLLQSLLQVIIYFSELHSVKSGASLSQVITYTGAANITLFVSLTPGAIGIREAFLLYTEKLHHISTANVITASILDRSVYLVFLLIIFILTLSLHAKDRLLKKGEATQQ